MTDWRAVDSETARAERQREHEETLRAALEALESGALTEAARILADALRDYGVEP